MPSPAVPDGDGAAGAEADVTFKAFMQGFYDLTSTDTAQRLEAAAAIVGHAEAAPATPAAAGTKPVERPALYAVNRLLRGVCSGREAARQGFAACAAEVLTVVPEETVSTPAAFDTLMEATKIAGSLRSHEERDLSLGRLFACAALARSGRLTDSEDLCVRALGAVAPLYWRRRWMRQAVGQVLLLLAEQLGHDALAERALPLMLPLLAPDAAPTAAAAAKAAGGKKKMADDAADDDEEEGDGDSEAGDEEAREGGGEGGGGGGGGGDLYALTVSEMSADQLAIALGLQRLLLRQKAAGNGSKSAATAAAAADKEIPAAAKLPKALRKRLLVPGNVGDLTEPLVASASSFPKIHAVWGEIWRQLGMDTAAVAGVTAGRTAGETDGGATDVTVAARAVRCKALGSSEEAMLKGLWGGVVDERLANGSHNTKGLSLLLLQQVLPLAPASAVSTLLSPSVARLLANHAASPEATLHGMAAACLEGLPRLTSDDSAARAAVVAALVAPGGSSNKLADSRLGTGTLAGLAEGMDEAALLAHVETLIAAATTPIDPSSESADSSNSRAGVPAVEALYALTKTIDAAAPSLASTSDASANGANGGYSSEWCGRVASFFLECGFFQPAAAGAAGNGAKNGSSENGSSSTDAPKVSTEVKEACRARFFSLVADVGRRPLVWRSLPGNAPGSGGGGAKRRRGGGQEAVSSVTSAVSGAPEPGALEVVWRLHAHWDALEAGGRQLSKQSRPNEEEIDARKQALAMVAGIRDRAAAAEQAGSGGDGGGTGGAGGASGRVEAGLAGVILHVSLQMLAADAETRARAADHLLSLLEVCRQLAPAEVQPEKTDKTPKKTGKRPKNAEEEPTEAEEEEEKEEAAEPMALLADVLTGVLSSPAGGLVRGLREVVKKAWAAVVAEVPAAAAAVGVLRAAVCGEDGEGEEEEGDEDEEDDEEDEEEDSDGDDASDDESDAAKTKTATKKLGSNGTAAAKTGKAAEDDSSEDEEEEEEGAEEDEVAAGSDVLAELLGKDGSNGESSDGSGSEDDEEGGLQHNAGADHALASMLALKQLGRKAGRAQAERESAQASLRALDLLEALCSKQPDNPHLPSLLPVVYSTVKRLAAGATSTPDGRALYGRLVALFSSRLCKAKPKGIDPETIGEGAWSPAEGTAFFLAEASRLDKRGSSGNKAGRAKGNSDDAALAAMATLGLFACVRVAMARAEAAAASADVTAGGKKAGGGGGKGNKKEKDAAKTEAASIDPEVAAAAATDATAVAAAVAEALTTYLSQRRSPAAAGQRFTELLRRAPALGPELMPTLLEAAASAQTDFLRAEAVRLLSEPLSQRKAMSPSARAKLVSQGPLMARALAAMLNPSSSEDAAAAAADDMEVAGSSGGGGSAGKGGKKAGRAKRLKPVLACCGALLKLEVEARGGGGGGMSDADLEQLAEAVRAAGNASESAPLTATCSGIAAKAESLMSDSGGGGGSGNGSEKKAKKGRKRQEDSSIEKGVDTEGGGGAAAEAAFAASTPGSEIVAASKSARKKQKRAAETAAAAEPAAATEAAAAAPANPAGSARKGRTRSSSDLAAAVPVAATPARKSGGKRAQAVDAADSSAAAEAAAAATPVAAKAAATAERAAAPSTNSKRRKVQK